MGVIFREYNFFQQDWTWPQTENAVLNVFNEHLHDQVLSDQFPACGCSW